MKEKCFIHRHKKRHAGWGWFYDDQIGRKYAWGRLNIKAKSYEAHLRLAKIHRAQQGQELAGRYFGLSKSGTIHLCRCRLTKKQIERSRKRAQKLFNSIKWK